MSVEAKGVVFVNTSPATVSSQISNANLAKIQSNEANKKNVIDGNVATLIFGSFLIGSLLFLRKIDKKLTLEDKDESIKQINQLRKRNLSNRNNNSLKV